MINMTLGNNSPSIDKNNKNSVISIDTPIDLKMRK